MQCLFLQISSITSRLLSLSAALGIWGDVVCAASRHIWCWNQPLSRQIGWGDIYGTRYQMTWLSRSNPPSWVAYATSYRRLCLTVEAIAPTENLKVYPSIMNQLHEIIFLNEFLGNVWEIYTHILRSIHLCLEVNYFAYNQTKRTLQGYRTLLIMSLTRSREPVGVPILLG